MPSVITQRTGMAIRSVATSPRARPLVPHTAGRETLPHWMMRRMASTAAVPAAALCCATTGAPARAVAHDARGRANNNVHCNTSPLACSPRRCNRHVHRSVASCHGRSAERTPPPSCGREVYARFFILCQWVKHLYLTNASPKRWTDAPRRRCSNCGQQVAGKCPPLPVSCAQPVHAGAQATFGETAQSLMSAPRHMPTV
jgi:hypothetical protein